MNFKHKEENGFVIIYTQQHPDYEFVFNEDGDFVGVQNDEDICDENNTTIHYKTIIESESYSNDLYMLWAEEAEYEIAHRQYESRMDNYI